MWASLIPIVMGMMGGMSGGSGGGGGGSAPKTAAVSGATSSGPLYIVPMNTSGQSMLGMVIAALIIFLAARVFIHHK
jgi:hypothetical protein